MPSLIDSIGNFISSIFGAITAVFSSILAVFQSLFGAIFGVFRSLLAAVGTMVSGLAQTFEGLLKFLFSKFDDISKWRIDANQGDVGNIVVIGAIVGALFLYGVYMQRNGQSVTAAPGKGKKVN